MSIDRRCVTRVVSVVATATVVVGMTASAGLAKPKPRVATPTLTASVATPTNSTTATFTFSSPTATKYTCTLDGKKSACTSPKTYVGLNQGAHTFSVIASRTGARASRAATFAWTIDRTPPPAVTFQNVPTAPVQTSPSITFTGEAGDAFACEIDGDPQPCAGSSTAAVVTKGTHSYTVVPTDQAGNVGPAATAVWVLDTDGPVIFVSNAPPTSTSTTPVDLKFVVTGADAPTHAVQCQLKHGATVDAAFADCPTTGTNAFHYSADTTVDGATYTVTIKATDAAGNISQTLVSWTFSSSAPALIVLSGPAPYINDPSSAAASITWPGAGSFQCAIDSGSFVSGCGSPFTKGSAWTEGPHSVSVDTDPSSSVAKWSWTLDETAPELSVTGGPGARTNATSATFAIAAQDDVALASTTCTLSLNGVAGSPSACPANGSFATPAAGSYSLAITATDAAGNATQVTKNFVVDRTPPVAKFSGLSSLTGPIKLTYGEPVSGLTSGALALTLTDSGNTVPTMRRCRNAAGKLVSCAGTFRSVALTPTSHLVPGQHYTLDAAAAAVHDAAGNLSAAVTRAFRGRLTLAENTVAATPSWQRRGAKAAYGGSFVREHLAGAAASYRFRGRAITWLTVTGPDQGKARVFVDGHRKGVVNNYAAARHFRIARTFRHLGTGAHVLTVRVLGLKGATAGRGTFVSIDAMKVGATVTKSPALAKTWRRIANAKLFGGHAAVANLAGETYVLKFRGTSVAWRTMTSRTQGKARVFLDGALKSTIDNYSASAKFRVARSLTGLADRLHTLRIVVTGTHHAGGRGTDVTVDGFRIG